MLNILASLFLVGAMTGKFKVNDRVVTEYGGKMYKATVVAINKVQYQIKYDSDDSKQWRNEERIIAMDASNEVDAVGAPPPPPKEIETEYKPKDIVYVDIPNQTKGKMVATISKNGSVACCGYYEGWVQFPSGGRELRIKPEEIKGRYDAATMKWKVGDKVVLRGQWLAASIAKVNPGFYTLKSEDPRQLGEMPDIFEEQILPPWPYKEFYDLLKDFREKNNSFRVVNAVRVMYPDAAPELPGTGNGMASVADSDLAKKQLDMLAPILAKFKDPPDTGVRDYRYNPSILMDVIKNRSDFQRKMAIELVKDAIERSYGSMLVDLTDPDKFVLDDKGHQIAWSDYTICGDLNALKDYMRKNIAKAIAKYTMPGAPDDYLREFDTKAAAIKAQHEKAAADTSWASSYRLKDPASNAQVAKAWGSGAIKILYGGQFELTRNEAGVVTNRAKTGIAVYKVPNCPYYRVVTFSQSQPYTGGGKYGKNEFYLTQQAMFKPF